MRSATQWTSIELTIKALFGIRYAAHNFSGAMARSAKMTIVEVRVISPKDFLT